MTTSVKERLELLYLYFVVKKRNFIEAMRVLWRYDRRPAFALTHILFTLQYLFINPYTIARRHLRTNGDDDTCAYGETPLTSFHTLATECEITEDDTLIELGCGRGLGMFWLNTFIGCHVIGVDVVPLFIMKGKHITRLLNNKEVAFCNDSFLNTDYSGVTTVYFYGTGFDEKIIESLISTLATLPTGTKIITVSYPLTDYTDNPIFTTIKSFPITFAWGQTDAYLTIINAKWNQ